MKASTFVCLLAVALTLIQVYDAREISGGKSAGLCVCNATSPTAAMAALDQCRALLCGTTVRRPPADRCVLLQTCPTNGIFWTRLRLLPLLTVPTALLPLLLPLRLQHHPLLHPVLPPTPTLTRQDQLQDRQDHQVQPCVFGYGSVKSNHYDKVLRGLKIKEPKSQWQVSLLASCSSTSCVCWLTTEALVFRHVANTANKLVI